MQDPNHIFFDDLSIILSQERLNSYLSHATCYNNKKSALIAHSWNIELSQALYPALQIFEITLRNTLHTAIRDLYDTEYWYELSFLHEREKKQIQQTADSLVKNKKKVEPCRVVADLSFGFWTSLFDVRYEHGQILWPKLLKSIFQFLSKTQKTRAFLSRELNKIRFLRNRVFHHEPIWHWQDLSEQHARIIYLTNALSPAASKYLDMFDTFENISLNGMRYVEEKLDKINC